MKKIVLIVTLSVFGLAAVAQNVSANEQRKSYYHDADGDGYGNPAEKLVAVSAPAGYVGDSTDCNDYDIDINAATAWFKDGDADGFGDPRISFTGCTPPPGTWVMNNWDADDTNKSGLTEDELVLICDARHNKEDATKWKNLIKKQNDGWLLCPCKPACGPGLIQMCHNGKLQCVAPEMVAKHLEQGGIKGPCLQPVSSGKSQTVNPSFPVPVADDEKTFVYPNPTTGEIFVRLPRAENGRVEILIVSSNGMVLEKMTKRPGGQTERFDLNKYGIGIYFVKVFKADEVEVFKVVFQRSFIQQ